MESKMGKILMFGGTGISGKAVGAVSGQGNVLFKPAYLSS
jgi:hypothetical protein